MERSTPHPSSGDAGNQRSWIAPFLKDPAAVKFILILIQEELKSRKLFQELHWLGYHNCFYQADLLDLIMMATGLQPGSSLQRSMCHELLDKHSQRVVTSEAELRDEARRVHEVLTRHAAFIATQPRRPPPKI